MGLQENMDCWNFVMQTKPGKPVDQFTLRYLKRRYAALKRR
jgi:hypothetical protein